MCVCVHQYPAGLNPQSFLRFCQDEIEGRSSTTQQQAAASTPRSMQVDACCCWLSACVFVYLGGRQRDLGGVG